MPYAHHPGASRHPSSARRGRRRVKHPLLDKEGGGEADGVVKILDEGGKASR
jgi:hypothetical protein